jgi:hypothetical protein
MKGAPGAGAREEPLSDIGLDRLSLGLMSGTVHLSMSVTSTAAASAAAAVHARSGHG